MTAFAAAQRLFQRLADAALAAWRHDPVFRGAAVAAGVSLMLFLLRVAGPHAPDLERPDLASTPLALRQSVPSPGAAPQVAQPPADVPKIAPEHPLSDVTIAPTLGSDRFGMSTSGKHP